MPARRGIVALTEEEVAPSRPRNSPTAQDAQELGLRLVQSVPGEWSEVSGRGWVQYTLEDAQADDDEALFQIVDALTAFILDVRLPAKLFSKVRRRRPELCDEALADVRDRAADLLAQSSFWPERVEYVRSGCYQGLTQEGTVTVLDGIETFLVPRLWAVVDDAIDQALDDFATDQEYEELLQVLEHFAGMRSDGPELVHVMADAATTVEEPAFALEDHHGNLLGGRTYEAEALVSELLAAAPGHIVLHTKDESREPFYTIARVFQERVEYCPGCLRCRNHHRFPLSLD